MITETTTTQIVCDGFNKKKRQPCTKGLVIAGPRDEAIAYAKSLRWAIFPDSSDTPGNMAYCPEHTP